MVSVFDISQTEGKELPALTYELTGNVEQYKDFFAALEKTSPFAMGFEAVSYTHLDVYKRQVPTIGNDRVKQIFRVSKGDKNMLPISDILIRSISGYVFIDVYKRQLWGRTLSLFREG